MLILVGTRSDDPIWQAVRSGSARFSRDAAELRVKEILPASDTPVAQKAALETIGGSELPRAVCVLATEARVLIQPILKLLSRGVHVVLVGDDAPQTRRRAFVGPDERAVGEAIGKTLFSACNRRRTLMVVHDRRAGGRSALRYEGLARALRLHADLKVLREFDCRGQPAKALQLLYETSERFPNLGGWALLDDWLGEDPAPDRPLVHGSAKIVSCGAHPGNFDLVEDGRVYALVGVDWEEIGYRAALVCYQLLSQSALPVIDYKAPPVVVTPENLDEHRKKWQDIISVPSSSPAPR